MDCIIVVMVMDVFEERDRFVRFCLGDVLMKQGVVSFVLSLTFFVSTSLIALPRVYAVFVSARLIAAPASAALMSLGTPWLPFILSLGMITVAQILSFFIPETVGYAEDAKPVDDDSFESSKSANAKKSSLGFAESAKFILNNRNMMPIIVAHLVSSIAKYAQILMLQYSSTRYDWSYSLSSLVLTIREASSLVDFLILIPVATAYLRRGIRGSVVVQDKLLCQGMGFFNLIGFSAVGLAGTPAIYMMAIVLLALGSGFDTTMSSFVTSLVQPDQIASLHSVIAMAKSIGGILAGPIFAYLMQLGLQLDGAWLGIPYYAAGLSFLMVMAAVASIRIPSRTLDEAEEPLLEA